MTNQEKIEKLKQLHIDFMASLEKLKASARERASKKKVAQEKAEIDELLAKINKDY